MKRKTLLTLLLVFVSSISFSCEKSESETADSLYGLDPNKAESYTLTQRKSSKRGMCSNLRMPDDISLYGPGISWLYTWGPRIENPQSVDPLLDEHGISFYPMAWNGNFDEQKVRETKAAHPECEYILAFNEPNHLGQAEMTPSEAAAAWPRLKALAAELDMKIISPALNYGSMPGYSDPVKWLDEFFAQPGVSLDDVAGIAIHCYMRNASSMASFVSHFYKYNKPIWMTEFCSYDGANTPENVQIEYVSDAVNYLEADPHVFAYAWFMDRSSGTTISQPYFDITTKQTPNRLSDVGTIYVHASSLDRDRYYSVGEIIPASAYAAHAASEAASRGEYLSGVRLRPTTDAGGVLEVFNFRNGDWIEYQVDVPADGTYRFDIRYAAEIKSMFDIYLQDGSKQTLVVDSTLGFNVWKTTCLLLDLKAGRQTIRLAPRANEGDIAFHWFRLAIPE